MTDPKYSLNYEDRGDYLYVYITGEDSFDASLRYWAEITEEVQRHKTNRLLVHENLVGELTAGEIYEILMSLKGSALVNTRIAFYDENRSDISLNALGQLIANNRGGHVHLFNTLEAAEKWIGNPD